MLPGEYEFQQNLRPSIPFKNVGTSVEPRLHCDGKEDCIYPQRPLDCRSYPYFPAVIRGEHVGYFDLRSNYSCPLTPEVELRKHMGTIHGWWSSLLKQPEILIWAESQGARCHNSPVMIYP